MPATLQAAIAARIDRLDGVAKRTLNAAAVIGSQFDAELPAILVGETALPQLVQAELIDQIKFTPNGGVRVSPSADSRGRLRVTAQSRPRRVCTGGWPPKSNNAHPDSADENAALIAEHLEVRGRSARRVRLAYARRNVGGQPRHRCRAHQLRRARDVADRIAGRHPGSPGDADRPANPAVCELRFASAVAAPRLGSTNCANCASRGRQALARHRHDRPGCASVHCASRQEATDLAAEQIRLLDVHRRPGADGRTAIARSPPRSRPARCMKCLRLADRVISLADGDAAMGA